MLLEIITGLSGVLGGVGALAEKVLVQKMAMQEKKDEREHIREMHKLSAQSNAAEAQAGLAIARQQGDNESFKQSMVNAMTITEGASQWVKNALAFFRPCLAVYLLYLTNGNPDFAPMAAAAVMWFFGSRSGHIGPRD